MERIKMSVKELLAEIEHLTFNERLELAEAIMRGLRESLSTDLRGILKPVQGETIDDQALDDDYIEYLEEKYR